MESSRPSIYLTSFFKEKELPSDIRRYSAAVFQPKGYNFPKASWTDIRDSAGQWTRPRNFLGGRNPAESYRAALLGIYNGRVDEAREWLASVESRSAALLCWCPYDKAAQRQIEEWGSFICHTAVLGEFLRTEFGVPVWYDADRLQLLPLTQKGM